MRSFCRTVTLTVKISGSALQIQSSVSRFRDTRVRAISIPYVHQASTERSHPTISLRFHNSTTTQHPHDTNTDIHPSRYNPTVPKNDAMTATSSFVRTKEAVCPAAFRWPTAGGKLGSELSDVVGSLRSYRLCLGRLQVDHYCPSAQIPTMLTSSRATVHTQARSYVEHGTQSCIPCCMLQCFPIDNTNHTSHSTAQRYQYPQFTSDHTTVPDPLPSEVPSCHQATNVKQLRSSRVDPSRN
eukprot:GHVQ01027096.1.p1 GENE.GHVQ01027096.1~~GHVQ01027096.1.p1  ORF type:complete len:241 (+),score=22.59 GHVQ01027096.1:1171-1893(+)